MQGRPFLTMSTRLPGISTELSTGRLSVEHPILSVCGIEGNAAGKAFLIIVNAALQREARRAVRPQIHSQSEFCARHCGCGEAAPEPRGGAILLTTAANLAREWHRCRLAFTRLWPFGGQRAPLEAWGHRGGSVMDAVARVNDQPLSPAGASAPVIDTQHLCRMTLGELSLQREVLALFDRQADMLAAAHPARGAGGGRGVGPHIERLGSRHRRLQGCPRRGSGRTRPRLCGSRRCGDRGRRPAGRGA